MSYEGLGQGPRRSPLRCQRRDLDALESAQMYSFLEVGDFFTGSPFDMECSVRDSQCLLHNRPFGFGTTVYESGTNIFTCRNWWLTVVGERISQRSVSAYYGAPKVSAVAPLAPVVVQTLRRKP